MCDILLLQLGFHSVTLHQVGQSTASHSLTSTPSRCTRWVTQQRGTHSLPLHSLTSTAPRCTRSPSAPASAQASPPPASSTSATSAPKSAAWRRASASRVRRYTCRTAAMTSRRRWRGCCGTRPRTTCRSLWRSRRRGRRRRTHCWRRSRRRTAAAGTARRRTSRWVHQQRVHQLTAWQSINRMEESFQEGQSPIWGSITHLGSITKEGDCRVLGPVLDCASE